MYYFSGVYNQVTTVCHLCHLRMIHRQTTYLVHPFSSPELPTDVPLKGVTLSSGSVHGETEIGQNPHDEEGIEGVEESVNLGSQGPDSQVLKVRDTMFLLRDRVITDIGIPKRRILPLEGRELEGPEGFSFLTNEGSVDYI